ncbi:MAG: isoleucine-tRNA ligase [Pseudomonadota bacterium]
MTTEKTEHATMDYKNTLNLPHTNFPMKASLPHREPAQVEEWQTSRCYETIMDKATGQPMFLLQDGPIYSNGEIHLGHALNKILKDIVVKSKRMSGFQAPFVPGWDCHGLPIELNVEKKIGKAGVKVDGKTFREACRAYANTQIEIQRKAFIRLGILADWEHPYHTMSYRYEANIIRSFKKIVENGHLYKGNRPVYWCLDCGSALAEAEVEYQDKKSPSIEVAFSIDQTSDHAETKALLNAWKAAGIHITSPAVVIWTTTPWTLPANEAVSLHPAVEYVLFEASLEENKRQQYIIADNLLSSFVERHHLTDVTVLTRQLGKTFELIQLQHPFFDKRVPIILGEHVTTDSGTGCVHTAPAHGQDDYTVGLAYQLPVDSLINGQGCFLADIPLVGGLSIYKANAAILEVLKAKGKLVSETVLAHSYPHCWRHKTPLIFRATPQWFVSMNQQGLRSAVEKAVDKVDFIPEWGKARLEGMIGTRPDWCISRQRTWGVPLALIVHKETQALHPNMVGLMEKVAELVEKNGIEAWHELALSSLLPPKEANQYEKIQDTLDVWFDSGVSYAYMLDVHPTYPFPADLYLEGSDQHRGWFMSSVFSAMAAENKAPYRAVLTHGYTVDGQGRKMSKSLGNVIAPEKIINTLGADVMRLWVSSTDYRGEVAYSDEIFKRNSEAYRRIRNTLRFLLANIDGFDPGSELVPTEALLALDKFMLFKTANLQKEIINAYHAYEFHLIYQKIQNFCIVDLGGLYLDIIKDRQYTMKKKAHARLSAQTVLYHMAEAMVRWIAPILSFTAEEAWGYLPGKRDMSVHGVTWYTAFDDLTLETPFDATTWETLLQARDAINKSLEAARATGTIGAALEASIIVYADEAVYKALSQLKNELAFFCITSAAQVRPLSEKPTTAMPSPHFPKIAVVVDALTDPKCVRCWHRRPDVNTVTSHPDICPRCVDNIMGEGEVRQYA